MARRVDAQASFIQKLFPPSASQKTKAEYCVTFANDKISFSIHNVCFICFIQADISSDLQRGIELISFVTAEWRKRKLQFP